MVITIVMSRWRWKYWWSINGTDKISSQIHLSDPQRLHFDLDNPPHCHQPSLVHRWQVRNFSQNHLSKKTLYQAFPHTPWGGRPSLWSCAEPLLGSSSYVHIPPTPQVSPSWYINSDAVQLDKTTSFRLSLSVRGPRLAIIAWLAALLANLVQVKFLWVRMKTR